MSGVESSENQIVTLRKLAQEMAASRRESLTTAHMLAAIASQRSPAADLLLDRRLDVDTLQRLARASTEDIHDPIGQAVRRASAVAHSSGCREPNAVHLLIALLKERKSGAFRALSQSGIDMARLRAAATAVANGLIEPRRTVSRDARMPEARQATRTAPSTEAARPMRNKPSTGTIVPLFPPKPRSSSPPVAAQTTPQNTASPAALERPSSPPPAVEQHAEPRRAPRAKPSVRKQVERSGQQSLKISNRMLERYELDAKAFPVLHALGTNLTLAAAQGELDPVVGREVAMEQALDVLAKRRANNPCLVGLPGVGKTAIARGLAARIVSDQDVRSLDDRILIEIPVTQLLAGTAVRGSLAERITAICKEVRQAEGKVVLMIDDAPQLFQADGGEASSELKLALTNGVLPIVATCTTEDYRRFIDTDPALAKCFTVLEIEEPTPGEAIDMLQGVCASLEQHHGVSIEQQAIASCVAWSVRYLPGRALPEKALSVLDLAGARARRRGRDTVNPTGVAEVIAEMADLPVGRLLETDRDRMLALEQLLSDRVVGHTEALARIATILRRNAAGLRGSRPIGSFLLLGTTGVGKTETAKAVAAALFHSGEAMTRLDLSEFAEPHALARLIGAPPGYVGHESGGQLTEAVRRRPYQVLLLDEFEKAHRDVQQSFLQVLDEGRMTDGRGRTIDFTNTVIVMTSNLGSSEAREAAQTRSIGFSRGADQRSRAIKDAVLSAAKSALPPELYNRIDEILFFAELTRDDIREVANLQLASLSRRLQDARGIELIWSNQGIDALLEHGGYDPTLGARPVRRAIARWVEAPIAELVLREEARQGDAVHIGADDDGSVALTVLPPERAQA